MTARSQRPTIIEIDLGALRRNYHALREAAGKAEVMVVIKADAYGHGAVPIAKTLAGEGCGNFGVATIAEAGELRDAGIKARIYLLGGFFPEQAREILALEVTPFIFDVSIVAPLNAAAKELGRHEVAVHLKIDSGATRLGVLPWELARAIEELRRATLLKLEGACTLFANAADPTSDITDRQLRVFTDALATLETAGMRLKCAMPTTPRRWCCGRIRISTWYAQASRSMGFRRCPRCANKIELTSDHDVKTRLMQMKCVPAGTGVSYGHTFVTQRESTIGILPVGYADGYRRGLQHGGEVLIGGRRAPVIAAVSMDLTDIDLTELPGVEVGDEVVLWGRQRRCDDQCE